MDCECLDKAISDGAFTRPFDVGHGCTCYDVERTWRGMRAFLEVVGDGDFGGRDGRFMPPDDMPLRLGTYGRWLMDYSPTKHIVVSGGRAVMYEYRESGSREDKCEWEREMFLRTPMVYTQEIDWLVRREPIAFKEELDSWVDGRHIKYLRHDMESDDEHVRAAVASKVVSDLITPDLLEALSHDPSPLVRAAVAKNWKTGPATSLRLAEDPDWHVRRALFERRLSHDGLYRDNGRLFRMVCDDPEFEVRVALAGWAYERMVEYSWMNDGARNVMAMLLDAPDDRISSAAAMALLAEVRGK